MSKSTWQRLRAAAADTVAALSGRRLAELREQRQLLESRTRLYEAAVGTDWRPRRGSNASADAVMQSASYRIRDEARHLDENDGLAVSILDDLVDNVVGHGRPIEPMARTRGGIDLHTRGCDQICAWYEKVWAYPDTTGELPGTELERLVARTLYRDGEVFGVHHLGNIAALPHGHGYLLEALEPDYVPFDLTHGLKRNTVVHGVELNQWRRPVAYHFLASHPGAVMPGQSLAGQTTRVAAERVVHPKFRRRFHQTRGVSVLHAAIPTLSDIKESWESERIAMRVAAAMTGFIKRGPEFVAGAKMAAQISDSTIGARSFELSPGMVWDGLLPGEDIGTVSHDRPNTNFDPFTASLQRTLAGATGTRFSSIANRYDGTYSAQRQELVEGAIAYRRLFAYLLGAFYRPVYRRIVDAGILAGAISVRGIDPATLYDVEIRPPALPWIQPKQEVDAYSAAVEAKLISRREAMRELGRDPRLTERLIEEEQAELAAMQADSPDEPDQVGDEEADPDDEKGEDNDEEQDQVAK